MVAEMLARYGVEQVFGQPGGQTAALYDGIAKRSPRIRHMLVRDERSSAYAADAYARLTGKPGVCDVTVGPGTTKLTDGFVESLNASVPVIAIVGELPSDWEPLRDKGVASQGFDQISFLKSITKATYTAASQRSLPQLIRSAFRTATSGRPGPVALVIPHDVMDAEWDGDETALEIDDRYTRAPAYRPVAPPDDIQEAADLLGRAQRPVIVAGGGVLGSRATDELTRLAETVDAVVVTTFTGKGSISETGPTPGRAEPPRGLTANRVVKRADLVFWCGSKVSQNTSVNWTIPAPEQATIHLDVDPAEPGRTFRPTVALNGDVKSTLSDLLNRVEPQERADWLDEVGNIKEEEAAPIREEEASDAVPLAPPRVMRELRERLSARDVVISDASFSAGWISAYLKAPEAGRNWIFARGQGGLGYSCPAALGAAVARPDDRVVTISGDGGFYYAIGELATQAQNGLKVINVVLNNGILGWLQMWEEIFFDGMRQSVDLETEASQPDFAAAGAAMGCLGIKVERPEELGEALERAFAAEGPVVLDIRIDSRATPLHSFRRRLAEGAEGRTFDRPGTTYELRPWNRSAEAADIEQEGVIAE
ncbi:thiamine pyrophosphate-binding protein [Rubrobacter marinus]|uniref:Thiamine pyrophosphate-binding protein n=2 Tax=Rubrobacter marinus TaxID=2653852 RepID=A0A6G8Q3J1_9ACTN|nr:thiamine pyrophosphate-binding protein [Rubrobacter marinus]